MANTLPTGSTAITDPNDPTRQLKVNADGSFNIGNSNPNGQTTMANSSPVVIASDQWKTGSGDGAGQTTILEELLGLYNSGGPVDSTGKPQSLSIDRIRSWQGKAQTSGTITSTVAGDTQLVFSVAPKTIMPGQLIRLTPGTTEYVKVSESYAVSSTATTIPLQTAVVNSGNTTAAWDIFAVNGPSTGGVLPTGLLPTVLLAYDTNAGLLRTLTTASVDGAATTPMLEVSPGLWNGATADRQRGNLDNISLVASGAYTTIQTSADQTNYNGRGVKVVLDMTTVGTGSVTLEIDGKDPVSGKYYAILTGAAVTTNVTNIYTVYPGVTVAANAAVSDALPRTWRVKVTANNANPATYSVGASVIV